MIALLLLQNWILMIEDDYMTIDSRHVRLPAQPTSETNQQLKCDLMHLVNVVSIDEEIYGTFFSRSCRRIMLIIRKNFSLILLMNLKRKKFDGN